MLFYMLRYGSVNILKTEQTSVFQVVTPAFDTSFEFLSSENVSFFRHVLYKINEKGFSHHQVDFAADVGNALVGNAGNATVGSRT